MAKNNLFSRMFGSGAKEKKDLKKMRKMHKVYTKLDAKLLKGTISKKELDNYHKIKEEMNNMAKKFTLKDGKFVLKTDDETKKDSVVDADIDVPEPPVEESVEASDVLTESEMADQITDSVDDDKSNDERAEIKDDREKEIEELEKAQQRLMMLRQQQAQEQMRQAQMQQEQMRQAQMQQEQMRQAQMQQQAQISSQRQRQADANIQAQMQQEQTMRAAKQQKNNMRKVHLYVSDLPELALGINEAAIPTFANAINKAINENMVFEFGPYFINGSKILMYRFE